MVLQSDDRLPGLVRNTDAQAANNFTTTSLFRTEPLRLAFELNSAIGVTAARFLSYVSFQRKLKTVERFLVSDRSRQWRTQPCSMFTDTYRGLELCVFGPEFLPGELTSNLTKQITGSRGNVVILSFLSVYKTIKHAQFPIF